MKNKKENKSSINTSVSNNNNHLFDNSIKKETKSSNSIDYIKTRLSKVNKEIIENN